MTQWRQAFRLTVRELRGGTKGFRIFLACLILGVMSIASVGMLNTSILKGLERDGEILLGGDIELRLSSRTITEDQRNYISARATLSEMSELRAMAETPDQRLLVELKAVDELYPLKGQVVLSPEMALEDALSEGGVAIDQSLLDRLGARIGDPLKIGQATFTIRATVTKEPDRVASVINFGPRVLLNYDSLAKTELIRPGSVVRNYYRLDLSETVAPQAFIDDLNRTFPEAGWRLRTPENAAPRVETFIERLALFLNFVGYTTLLIGGVGISAGVRDFISGKIATIATFKCLGASSSLIFKTYFLQIFLLGLIGIGIGLILGTAVPLAAMLISAEFFPVRPQMGVYPLALLQAGLFGLISALTFTLWPLGRAQDIPARALFRDKTTPLSGPPAKFYQFLSYGLGLSLAVLILITAHRMDFAVVFILGAGATLLLLKLAGRAVVGLAEKLPHSRNSAVRLAVTALYRPGTNAPFVILSLGLGLSVLVTVTQIDQNLRGQISDNLPKQAPTYFFIDVHNDQAQAFDEIFTDIKGTSNYQRYPSLRARITEIDGVPVDQVKVAPESQWAVRGDRALSYSANLREGTELAKGSWWSEDYSGPPQISLDANLAKGFGVDLGDTLTLNILGRDVEATITSLRAINWKSMRFDFAIIMSPGLLERAPHSHIAAVSVDQEAQESVEKRIAEDHPNVSIVRVEDALQAAQTLIEGIAKAVGVAAAFTLLAGILVLGGTMSSGRDQRTYEAIVFKVLGATRRRMLWSYLIEYSVLGLVTGVISAVIGTLAAFGVVGFVMNMDWQFYPATIFLTVSLCLVLTICVGFAGTWSALGEKAAPRLRNE